MSPRRQRRHCEGEGEISIAVGIHAHGEDVFLPHSDLINQSVGWKAGTHDLDGIAGKHRIARIHPYCGIRGGLQPWDELILHSDRCGGGQAAHPELHLVHTRRQLRYQDWGP